MCFRVNISYWFCEGFCAKVSGFSRVRISQSLAMNRERNHQGLQKYFGWIIELEIRNAFRQCQDVFLESCQLFKNDLKLVLSILPHSEIIKLLHGEFIGYLRRWCLLFKNESENLQQNKNCFVGVKAYSIKRLSQKLFTVKFLELAAVSKEFHFHKQWHW